MKRFWRLFGGCLLLTAIPAPARENLDRSFLFPKLRVGQVISYQIGYRATTNTNTESNVAAPMAPTGGQTNANIILQVEVEDLRQDAGIIVARLRTQIFEPDTVPLNPAAPPNSPLRSSTPDTKDTQKPGAASKVVEFTLHSDGKVTDVRGLDKLSPDDRAAWQEWVDRFGGGAALPEKGVKPREKWKREEPIPNSQLAGLFWEKESEYVSDAPCAALKLTLQGDPSASQPHQETCAVILTTATLKQKSSPKDATPEDYKLHNLRNMGAAKGANQIISYYSLATGLLVRATEDAKQSMNLTVATSDGSNRVHYTVEAESHARVLLLANGPSNRP